MSRTFDAIVIGSGLGGLTAGALYARAGRKVLVLERNPDFGGAATVYQHGALAIEASLHEIDGLDSEDPKTPILRALGLDKDVTFVDVGDLMEVRSPVLGKPFVLPQGFDAALAAAKQRFPHQATSLDEYFTRLVAVRQAVVMMSGHQHDVGWWIWHAPELPNRLWPLLRDRHATLGEVLQRLFGDDEAIKLALASNIAYYTDNPDTIPFLSFAIAQASYLLGGGHYVRGGSRALTDRLVAIIREAGGEAEPGREVYEIILADDRVCGVRHRARGGNDSREELAPIAFGNAAPEALAEMLPAHIRPNFTEPYRDRHPSISLWTISVGLNRRSHEFGVRSYSTAILPEWQTALSDFRVGATLLGDNPGTRMPPYVLVAYDQIDSGLNANGPYLASMVGIDRIDNWVTTDIDAKRLRKVRWMDRAIADLDKHFPGIGSAVIQREMATAETLRHYLNTPDGAVYGFAPQIDHFGPAPQTAIARLYLASAFTGGGGYTGAILGGGSAARAALAVTKEFVTVQTAPLTLVR
jgi:all-trans-retinol 13,14-reductase